MTKHRVELTYFRTTGKYYSGDATEIEFEAPPALFQVWEEIDRQLAAGLWPGLCKTGKTHAFFVLVNVPTHEHDHPRLITKYAN